MSAVNPIEIKIVGENSIQGSAEVPVTAGDRILWVNTLDQECVVSFASPFKDQESGCVFHVPARGSTPSGEVAGDKGEYQFTIKFEKPTRHKHRGNPRIIIR